MKVSQSVSRSVGQLVNVRSTGSVVSSSWISTKVEWEQRNRSFEWRDERVSVWWSVRRTALLKHDRMKWYQFTEQLKSDLLANGRVSSVVWSKVEWNWLDTTTKGKNKWKEKKSLVLILPKGCSTSNACCVDTDGERKWRRGGNVRQSGPKKDRAKKKRVVEEEEEMILNGKRRFDENFFSFQSRQKLSQTFWKGVKIRKPHLTSMANQRWTSSSTFKDKADEEDKLDHGNESKSRQKTENSPRQKDSEYTSARRPKFAMSAHVVCNGAKTETRLSQWRRRWERRWQGRRGEGVEEEA